jgi:hypothetical protein
MTDDRNGAHRMHGIAAELAAWEASVSAATTPPLPPHDRLKHFSFRLLPVPVASSLARAKADRPVEGLPTVKVFGPP